EYLSFFEQVLRRVAKEPYHDAEIERVKKLVWWDEVRNAVKGEFPASPDVFHIHPVAMVGNLMVGGCSCGKPLTLEQLQAIVHDDVLRKGAFCEAYYAGVRGYPIVDFLKILNEKMEKYGITRCLHKAHFLSQLAHECDQIKTNEEYRNSDGSIPRGWDEYRGGWSYHGRGLIQLTHVDKYSEYGDAIGNKRIDADPDIVSHSVELTVDSACWYWRHGSAWGDINPMSEQSDFLKVTMAVNGGYRHVKERNLLLIKMASLVKLDQCHSAVNVKLKNFIFSESALSKSGWHKKMQERLRKSKVSCRLYELCDIGWVR
ncbi:hypothetical protein FAZ69_31275, partial [Trinickia terrae]